MTCPEGDWMEMIISNSITSYSLIHFPNHKKPTLHALLFGFLAWIGILLQQ